MRLRLRLRLRSRLVLFLLLGGRGRLVLVFLLLAFLFLMLLCSGCQSAVQRTTNSLVATYFAPPLSLQYWSVCVCSDCGDYELTLPLLLFLLFALGSFFIYEPCQYQWAEMRQGCPCSCAFPPSLRGIGDNSSIVSKQHLLFQSSLSSVSSCSALVSDNPGK